MLEPRTKYQVRDGIISILMHDDRTQGHLEDIKGAMEIVESIGVLEFPSNWQLSMDTDVKLPQAALDAVHAAEQAAQKQWSLAIRPFGMSVHDMD